MNRQGVNGHGVNGQGGAARPIGVFDSGVGGLSVLAELRRLLPHEDFVYLADSAHCPYGERVPADIERLTLAAVRWLEAQGCKLVVIACNTACAFSLHSVRAAVSLPVVGLVPALKPAVQQTRSGVVGVFATAVTLDGSLLQDVIEQYAVPAGVQVLKVWNRQLVPLVESGQSDAHETRVLLRALLTPLAQAGADALVLGCTHYPYLAPSIRAEFGDTFALHDSGAGVARRTLALLERSGGLNGQGRSGQVTLYTTGQAAQVNSVLQQWLPDTPPVQPAPLYSLDSLELPDESGELRASLASTAPTRT